IEEAREKGTKLEFQMQRRTGGSRGGPCLPN
ncbi:hypothetical protein CCACVL1_26548, partial [Corchorus capsularis]